MENRVFILGAGCSVEDGVPLMDNFLIKSKEVFKQLQKQGQKESFEEVFDFQNKNLPGSNIEELFTFIDSQLQYVVGSDPFSKRLDCEFLIKETVKRSQLSNAKSENYGKFFKSLKETDTVLTFNWDTLADDSLNDAIIGGIDIDYGINFDGTINKEGKLTDFKPKKKYKHKLFKLHGSLNWLICIAENPHRFLTLGYEPNMHHNGSYYRCKKCGDGSTNIFIVPPTLSKANQIMPILKVWKAASKELKDGDKIIIIGYSFPKTDAQFKLFFEACINKNFAKNNRKIKIEIVNHKTYLHERSEFERHHSELFKNIRDKIEINFNYSKFGDYVSVLS